jgi:tRNA threonylcarbamoyladenosine biosynthesis protein TsaB
MLLGLKTDNPTAELYLMQTDGTLLASKVWEADRQLARFLLREITIFLEEQKCALSDLEGLAVFRGPGSFTGLRIGLTVANSLAYSLVIPVVGEGGDGWKEQAVRRLADGEDEQVVLPEYGAPARITTQKK